MNILVIHETEYIDKPIFEYQIIPEILSSRGHRVVVIDYPMVWNENPGKIFCKSQSLYNVRRANKKEGVTLIRPAFVKIPALSRFSAWISYFFIIPKAIVEYQIDCIYLYSVPTNGIQAVLMAKLYKIPIYFRLIDVLNQLVPNKLLSLVTKFLEKIVYKNVDQLSSITHRLVTYAIELNSKPEICSFLPTGADGDLFFQKPKNQTLIRSLGIEKDDIVLLFSGTLYRFSGLDWIVSNFPEYLKKVPNLKLLIIGNGEQTEFLKSKIKSLNLENRVIMTGFINYKDLPDYINLGDVCINMFEINEITQLIFPSKIYQYLSCRKPVIATRLKGMLDIYPDNNTRGVFYISERKDFLDVIEKALACKKIYPDMTLQEIADVIEKELFKLVSLKLS